MIEVLQIGVAAWMVYEAIRAVTPVYPELQPILVAAICYGLTWAPPVVLTVLCSAAIVACFRMLIGLTARPIPVNTPPAPRLRDRIRRRQQPGSSRIPELP